MLYAFTQTEKALGSRLESIMPATSTDLSTRVCCRLKKANNFYMDNSVWYGSPSLSHTHTRAAAQHTQHSSKHRTRTHGQHSDTAPGRLGLPRCRSLALKPHAYTRLGHFKNRHACKVTPGDERASRRWAGELAQVKGFHPRWTVSVHGCRRSSQPAACACPAALYSPSPNAAAAVQPPVCIKVIC